jgi:hypothetical protein
MSELQIALASFVFGVALLSAVFGVGWSYGADAERDRHADKVAELLARIDGFKAAAHADAERLVKLEADAARLGLVLEDEAHADDDAGRDALGVDSVRRIHSR